uniref:L,D-transpeptidase n=1 Tax=Candidatus Blochmannia nearcticus (nom. nud.) TaxID=251545 RepID=D2XN95_9ENTR|nr:L,D-transpeptidase [Candidatus Blochmannia nearcticus]
MNKKIYLLYILLASMIIYPYSSFAIVYALPKNNNRLVGENIEIFTPKNNIRSLEYFSAQFQVGISNMLEANPDVDVYLPDSEKKLIIPHKLILPNKPHSGIVINNAEMRLYYYPKKNDTVIVLPIAIGTIEHATPSQWITSIKQKKKNPIWIPTKSMHDEYMKHGKILPTIFPAGPNNPMGSYALYLGKYYAIHGTNSNFGIGLRVTRGCIRLRPQDIEYLFNIVPIGTKVQFINEPIKSTIETNGMQYLEVHNPLSCNNKKGNNHTTESVTKYLTKKIQSILADHDPNIDYNIVKQALQDRSGIPINITRKQKYNNSTFQINKQTTCNLDL